MAKRYLTENIATIALFGTSADPPTAGHQTILRWLSDRFDLVAVWAADNPYKEQQTPLDDRMEMLRLSIAEINSQKHNIKLYPELSDRRTLNTINKAREIWGDRLEYTLVIGSDLTQQICHWYCVEEIFKLAKLIVIPRPNHQIVTEDIEAIEKLGGQLSIADLDTPDVSSSDYRTEKDRQIIPHTVADYIQQKKLYADRF